MFDAQTLDLLVNHKAYGLLVFTVLGLWPVFVITRRLGAHPAATLLWLLNLVAPLLGYTALGLVLMRHLPKTKMRKREKTA